MFAQTEARRISSCALWATKYGRLGNPSIKSIRQNEEKKEKLDLVIY